MAITALISAYQPPLLFSAASTHDSKQSAADSFAAGLWRGEHLMQSSQRGYYASLPVQPCSACESHGAKLTCSDVIGRSRGWDKRKLAVVNCAYGERSPVLATAFLANVSSFRPGVRGSLIWHCGQFFGALSSLSVDGHQGSQCGLKFFIVALFKHLLLFSPITFPSDSLDQVIFISTPLSLKSSQTNDQDC